jgi:two-component system sensor histidine kinase TctE
MKPLTSSIRRQLLAWLLLPIMTLWLIGAILTYVMAINFATDAYDNSLLDSARTLIARLRFDPDHFDVDLSPEAQAIFKESQKDKFFYEVVGPTGITRAGDTNIPDPTADDLDGIDEEPYFRYGKIDNEAVRIALVSVPVPQKKGQRVLIQIAETLKGRQELTKDILIWVVVPQLILIFLAALAVYIGVKRGLAPLKSVQQAVASRTRWDLSALQEEGAPQEVRPLVLAINDLLARIKEDIDGQRRFVANAAHQLRTPLAGLKTQTEFALRQTEPEDLRHALAQVQSSADRATHLVNQLLALAKVEPGAFRSTRLKEIDLNFIAKEATGDLVPQALRKGIDLGFEGSNGPATVSGDALTVRELVCNLIDNAVRYTQTGGKVTVNVSSANPVELKVEDNGPGIPEDERERVFERFYRVLGSGVSGSGLGLAIVREIAQTHQAEVTLSSGPSGDGTAVAVKFPPPHVTV